MSESEHDHDHGPESEESSDVVAEASRHEEPQEEFFNNEATDVEVEETEDEDAAPKATKPWDPAKIRISTKPFSLRQILDMIEEKDIDIAPDFQRLYVWKPSQRSRLIESILLGIPLPAFYFNQDHQGAMQVVDGVQRLTTIFRFAKKEELLKGLEYLKNLEGQGFDDLETALRRRFQQTQIFVHIIEPQTPDDVKFDVFRRINTGGSPLTAQEIRHCMSGSRSRDLLKELAAQPRFQEATAHAFRNERRMVDREVILRFLAFRQIQDIHEYRKFDSLDAFLLDMIRQIDGTQRMRVRLSEARIAQLRQDFERAMRGAAVVFVGNAAFRKFPQWTKRRGPINRALFESWAVALADYEPEVLGLHASKIFREARKIMGDREYSSAISQGTGDFRKVELRFSAAREILERCVRGSGQ